MVPFFSTIVDMNILHIRLWTYTNLWRVKCTSTRDKIIKQFHQNLTVKISVMNLVFWIIAFEPYGVWNTLKLVAKFSYVNQEKNSSCLLEHLSKNTGNKLLYQSYYQKILKKFYLKLIYNFFLEVQSTNLCSSNFIVFFFKLLFNRSLLASLSNVDNVAVQITYFCSSDTTTCPEKSRSYFSARYKIT